MTIVLLNSTKIKPRQHILAVPFVTSPGIIRSEHLLMDFNISSHNCWVYISSKFNFQVAWLKVKETVAIFRKKIVIAIAPPFVNGI